jgi:hypothetical protein
MNTWWTTEESSTILGYAGSAVGLCWAMVGVGTVLAQNGKAKTFVLAMGGSVIGLGAAACVGALMGLVLGQPSHVIQPLSLGGGMVGALGVVITVIARKRYAETEQRRLDAGALRRG